MLAVVLLVGCSDGENNDPCDPEDPPATDRIASSTLRLGHLSIESRTAYDAQGTKTHLARIALDLADLSLGTTVSRPSSLVGDLHCFALTGVSSNACRDPWEGDCGGEKCAAGETCVQDACVPCTARPLRGDSAALSGLSNDALPLDALGEDGAKWTKAGLDAPLFSQPATLTLSVEGADETGRFPSYAQSFAAPAPLEVTAPDPMAPDPIGQVDLTVQWVAGNGSWMEAVLEPMTDDQGTVGDKVVCLASDDGCMAIPAGALAGLRDDLPADGTIKLSLRRVVSSTIQLQQGSIETVVQAKAQSRVDMILAQ